MRLILNVIWFVFGGLWLAIGYAFAALICFLLIITIPFGIAALRIAIFALWPFGKTVVKRGDAGYMSKPAVIVSVEKQPNVDTVQLTRQITQTLAELEPSLP